MTAIPLANWNGNEMPLDQVRVSALDRAFLFGDAVYEGIRAYDGRVWLLDEHMTRLSNSLDQVRIQCDAESVRSRILSTLKNSGVMNAVIYVQISRGVAATRAHRFPTEIVSPSELIFVTAVDKDPYRDLRASGAMLITQPDLRWGRTDIKSTNLLANCLANQSASEAGCFEAILVAKDGTITEGSHTSFFAVRDGKLFTAPNSHSILPGVTRGFVIELARKNGIETVEKPIQVDDIAAIDEAFLTGTGCGVLSVATIDGRKIGNGSDSTITTMLEERYRREVENWLSSDEQPS